MFVRVAVSFLRPCQSRLREIFLKYNNFIKGKYLAEITTQVFDDLESNKYQFAEYRLSIYGREATEWNALAQWVVDHKLFSANIRWMIQIPRLYSIYKAAGQLKNFEEMLSSQFLEHSRMRDELWRIVERCTRCSLSCSPLAVCVVAASQTSLLLCSR